MCYTTVCREPQEEDRCKGLILMKILVKKIEKGFYAEIRTRKGKLYASAVGPTKPIALFRLAHRLTRDDIRWLQS
jgi:hypothetical protein